MEEAEKHLSSFARAISQPLGDYIPD